MAKWPFLVDFIEYGSENGPCLCEEWSKIDATNVIVLEKDCFTIAVFQFSSEFLKVSPLLLPMLDVPKNWFLKVH